MGVLEGPETLSLASGPESIKATIDACMSHGQVELTDIPNLTADILT